jgi:hypothetical protein
MNSNPLSPPSCKSALPNTLRCIQINLRRCKAASLALAQVILDHDIDVALIQEPFAYSATTPVVANIPPDFSSFHQLSADHAYGSAILVCDHIVKSGKLSTCHLSNSSACVALNANNGTFRLASVYLRSSLSLPDFSTSVSTIFSSVASPHSLICVDSNAKSPVWNSASTNQIGSELERLFKMSVANQQGV